MAFNGVISFGLPLAVSRLVILGVIDSSYRVFRSWTWPHIGQKGGKTFLPGSAHADPFSTVPFVIMFARRIASTKDMSPDSIFLRSSRLRAMTMDSLSVTDLPRLVTPAAFRSRLITPKRLRANYALSTTLTPAIPSTPAASFENMSERDHVPKTEPSTGKINPLIWLKMKLRFACIGTTGRCASEMTLAPLKVLTAKRTNYLHIGITT